MALLGSAISNEVGLQLLLYPLGSNVVVRTACCSVGVVLPVYSTFKAIERKDQNEQQKWLLYWAAYGSFSLVEVFSDKLLSWVPVYYHLKFAFLVWLQLPATGGAKKVYTNHLRPFFLRHQAKVDRILGSVYNEMGKTISAHQAEIQYLRTMIMRIMGSDEQSSRIGPARPNQAGSNLQIEDQTRQDSDTESDIDD
ncbi:HVA22-like protein k isoform X1 [Cucurbita moschata]|uniref:HVA22-like protein n=1 Tax=Cucurbita moschata TaxID=3662 RepID=A0A6J1HGF9_CUCMO|nr:HVA22-like protein k isoform X1 [Cucurbita moschata]